ncbi:MAG: hypothetical protein KDA61_03045, partial [Planctomycetales bacterium]|nr:hypothetical protein [Planctomycetales bacterium]
MPLDSNACPDDESADLDRLISESLSIEPNIGSERRLLQFWHYAFAAQGRRRRRVTQLAVYGAAASILALVAWQRSGHAPSRKLVNGTPVPQRHDAEDKHQFSKVAGESPPSNISHPAGTGRLPTALERF